MNSLLSAHVLSGIALPAGMPSVQLSDFAALRMQTLSFCLLVLVLCTLAVRAIWNHLARDFPSLPRLTFKAAGGVVVLWGLVFVLVLTMISGARELMTPGAWERDGLTWRLTSPPDQKKEATTSTSLAVPVDDWNSDRTLELRRTSLERAWIAVWQYALQHDRQFPGALEYDELPAETRYVAGRPGIYYRYVPGVDVEQTDAILLYEPEVAGQSRLAIRVDGVITLVDREWLEAHVPPGPEIHDRPAARRPVEAPRPRADRVSEEAASAGARSTGEPGTGEEAAP